MISARVIASLRVVSGYVVYTIERDGPPPNVTHAVHDGVGVVQGTAGGAAVMVAVDTKSKVKSASFRICGGYADLKVRATGELDSPLTICSRLVTYTT